MNLQEIVKRFLRNAAMIVGSRITFGLLNLATNALVVHAFGLVELGVLILLQVYVRLFANLVNINSWQAILSFGAPLQEKGDERGLRRLLGFTLGVDLVSASCAILVAILFTPLAASIFGWPDDVTALAPYFVVSVFFIIHGTPNGILRLVDRVDILAAQFAVNALVRFCGVLLVMFMDGGIVHLVLVWFAANVLSGLLTMIFAGRAVVQYHLYPIFDVSWFDASKRFSRIWRFLIFSNLSNSSSLIYVSGTVTVAGILFGPAAAATFQIAKQFSSAISRPSEILGPVISPEFARLAAVGDWVTFNTLIKKQLLITTAVLGTLAIILFLILGFIVNAVYGPELVAHLWLFQLLIFASILTMITFSFEPSVLAVNNPSLLLSLQAIAVLVYVIVCAILLQSQGIYAFGYGFLTSQICYVSLFSFLGARHLKQLVMNAQ